MNFSTYRISLDIQTVSSQVQIPLKKRDNNTRRIIATLMSNGTPYTLTDDVTVVFSGKKPDGKVLYNHCVLEDNKIIYDITEQTTAAAGVVQCEFKVYGNDNSLLTAPRFDILVDNTVYDEGDEIESSDEFSALTELVSKTTELIEDVETKLENGDFVGPQGPPGIAGMTVHVVVQDLPDAETFFREHPLSGDLLGVYSEPVMKLDYPWSGNNQGELYVVMHDRIDDPPSGESVETFTWVPFDIAYKKDLPLGSATHGTVIENNRIKLVSASESEIRVATSEYKPIVPSNLGYGVGNHGVVKLSVMPTAESKYKNWIVCYTGESDGTYIKNRLYTCVNDDGYKWVEFVLDSPLAGYEVLADITLAEDVNILEIPEETVAGYKDLFLLASLQTVGTSGDNQIAIQSVKGVLYFIYSSYTNKIDTHYGFWHLIETVGTVDNQYIYKSTFPKKLLANTSGNLGTFTWQGLNTNISEIMHDMTINKKAITYYRVVILGGNTFAAGSRFVLYGKRG